MDLCQNQCMVEGCGLQSAFYVNYSRFHAFCEIHKSQIDSNCYYVCQHCKSHVKIYLDLPNASISDYQKELTQFRPPKGPQFSAEEIKSQFWKIAEGQVPKKRAPPVRSPSSVPGGQPCLTCKSRVESESFCGEHFFCKTHKVKNFCRACKCLKCKLFGVEIMNCGHKYCSKDGPCGTCCFFCKNKLEKQMPECKHLICRDCLAFNGMCRCVLCKKCKKNRPEKRKCNHLCCETCETEGECNECFLTKCRQCTPDGFCHLCFEKKCKACLSTNANKFLKRCGHYGCEKCKKFWYCPFCNPKRTCQSCKQPKNEICCEHSKCLACRKQFACDCPCQRCQTFKTLEDFPSGNGSCPKCEGTTCESCFQKKCDVCESQNTFKYWKKSCGHTLCRNCFDENVCFGCFSSTFCIRCLKYEPEQEHCLQHKSCLMCCFYENNDCFCGKCRSLRHSQKFANCKHSQCKCFQHCQTCINEICEDCKEKGFVKIMLECGYHKACIKCSVEKKCSKCNESIVESSPSFDQKLPPPLEICFDIRKPINEGQEIFIHKEKKASKEENVIFPAMKSKMDSEDLSRNYPPSLNEIKAVNSAYNMPPIEEHKRNKNEILIAQEFERYPEETIRNFPQISNEPKISNISYNKQIIEEHKARKDLKNYPPIPNVIKGVDNSSNKVPKIDVPSDDFQIIHACEFCNRDSWHESISSEVNCIYCLQSFCVITKYSTGSSINRRFKPMVKIV